jgi:DNA-directed RNA polymerase subunit RPC12/RpoP
MSSQEQTEAGSAGALQNAGVHPNCPRCQRRMRVKQVSPVMLAAELDDVVYGCERCGTDVKQTMKRA